MKHFIMSSLLLALIYQASAQSKELSISLSSYKVEVSQYYNYGGSKELHISEDITNLFNIGLGYNVPVFTPHSNLGIGINATLTGGFRILSNASRDIFGDFGLPVTASIRYGAGSTREAYLPVGIGIGAGGRLNAMIVPSGDPFYIEDDPVAKFLVNPYFFVEVILDYKKRGRSLFDNLKIQFAFQPDYSTSGTDYSGDEVNATMQYYSISLIRFNALD